MAKIANLGRARKDRARAERKAKADANAALHGLPLAERRLAAAERALAERRQEGHRLAQPEPDTAQAGETAPRRGGDPAR